MEELNRTISQVVREAEHEEETDEEVVSSRRSKESERDNPLIKLQQAPN